MRYSVRVPATRRRRGRHVQRCLASRRLLLMCTGLLLSRCGWLPAMTPTTLWRPRASSCPRLRLDFTQCERRPTVAPSEPFDFLPDDLRRSRVYPCTSQGDWLKRYGFTPRPAVRGGSMGFNEQFENVQKKATEATTAVKDA